MCLWWVTCSCSCSWWRKWAGHCWCVWPAFVQWQEFWSRSSTLPSEVYRKSEGSRSARMVCSAQNDTSSLGFQGHDSVPSRWPCSNPFGWVRRTQPRTLSRRLPWLPRPSAAAPGRRIAEAWLQQGSGQHWSPAGWGWRRCRAWRPWRRRSCRTPDREATRRSAAGERRKEGPAGRAANLSRPATQWSSWSDSGGVGRRRQPGTRARYRQQLEGWGGTGGHPTRHLTTLFPVFHSEHIITSPSSDDGPYFERKKKKKNQLLLMGWNRVEILW